MTLPLEAFRPRGILSVKPRAHKSQNPPWTRARRENPAELLPQEKERDFPWLKEPEQRILYGGKTSRLRRGG